VGIHLTDVPFWHIFQKPRDLSSAEQEYLAKNERWQREDGADAMIQGTRPRTAAAGLRDSPTGLAGWLIEKSGSGALAAATSSTAIPRTSCSPTP
jgi:hypothetical protein